MSERDYGSTEQKSGQLRAVSAEEERNRWSIVRRRLRERKSGWEYAVERITARVPEPAVVARTERYQQDDSSATPRVGSGLEVCS